MYLRLNRVKIHFFKFSMSRIEMVNVPKIEQSKNHLFLNNNINPIDNGTKITASV